MIDWNGFLVGAGFSGIALAYKINRNLENVDFVIYEKNGDVGGTWSVLHTVMPMFQLNGSG